MKRRVMMAGIAAASIPRLAFATLPNITVFFDWGQADLKPSAAEAIKVVCADYKRQAIASITLQGHTDRSEPDRLELSELRAAKVRDVVAGEGISPSVVAVIGYGDERPLVPTAEGVRSQENRRVEMLIVWAQSPQQA
jgi:outer membrane protein OmpA-like peptidoglycan-associated protein